jgi:hypothetical protein
MGISYNPRIVTQNLLLNLDFGNIQKCYNGSENLLTYSEQFDNAAWSISNVGIVTNTSATTAPDGTTRAEKLVENTANAQHFIYASRTGSNETVTFSVFAKAAERTKVFLQLSNFVNATAQAFYDLSTGIAEAPSASNADYSNNSSSIIAYPNGWYRCILTTTKGSVNTTNNLAISVATSSGIVYTGDGTSGIYIWGAQVERGYVASPYVATVASTVTRPTTATSTISNYSHTLNQPQYISYDGTNNSIRFDRNETFVNFTGYISGTVLTVSAVSIGTFTTGMALSYTGLTSTLTISSFGTGTGNTGTYNLSANVGTITSRAMTAAYKIGGSMSVDTSGALASNTYLYNDHTTEVWARINDRNPAYYDAYEGANVLVTFAGYHSMFLYEASTFYYLIWDNTGTTPKYTSSLTLGTSGTDIIQGQWFHVAVTKSGSTFKTYLNGVLKKTDTITSTALSGVSNRLALGSAYDNNAASFNYYAKNNVGCLKMYNATLSADEISQNFNALRSRFSI